MCFDMLFALRAVGLSLRQWLVRNMYASSKVPVILIGQLKVLRFQVTWTGCVSEDTSEFL